MRAELGDAVVRGLGVDTVVTTVCGEGADTTETGDVTVPGVMTVTVVVVLTGLTSVARSARSVAARATDATS